MSRHTYGKKGYPTYTNVPAQQGGYAHGPKQPGDWYVVETTTIERFQTPGVRYINFGDQEYNHGPSTLISPKYAPKDHHEGYEPDYGSDNDNSGPSHNHGRESLMDKFLDKVRIKGSQPVKTSNLSNPKKYQPTNLVHNYPLEEAHPIRTRNLSTPNKYQPTSPKCSHLPEEAHLIRPTNLSGPNKYRPTSPKHSYPSEEANSIKTKNLLGPNKYQPTSPKHTYHSEEAKPIRTKNWLGPNKYQPTSPEHIYPSEEATPIRTKNLPGPNKYQPTSPRHSYPSEEAHQVRSKNFPGPNKYQPTSPMPNYPSDETQLIRNFSGLNNQYPSSPRPKSGQLGHFSGPKNHWQNISPPMTHHPLTNVTNDMNEALGFLEESINYSQQSGPNKIGAFDNFSTHPQSIESDWQYAKPPFTSPTNFPSNTIDSQEAIRKYQGTRVP